MSKKRILTGIQSSGVPHLGNILGAIIPAIKMSENENTESLFFIADMHSITTIKDKKTLIKNTYAVASAWLAFGFDIEKNIFYRQSDIPEVTELTWYLNCITPYPMLANAHSFKDKSDKLFDVNAGLFDYPVLMTADILLYDANIVPVGKDQIQHLEICRDIAGSFNKIYGDIFTLPEAKVNKKIMTIPGIDGQKMSKSYNNFIDIFLPEKQLKKNIMKIITDSTSIEKPKKYESCNIFKLYSLLANNDSIEQMKKNYTTGNYGYGQAKTTLFELIMDKYKNERTLYNDFMNNIDLIENKLLLGKEKAKNIAQKKLSQVRKTIGFN